MRRLDLTMLHSDYASLSSTEYRGGDKCRVLLKQTLNVMDNVDCLDIKVGPSRNSYPLFWVVETVTSIAVFLHYQEPALRKRFAI